MPNNRYSERELSAICSNLAKACEKQHKVEEASLFKDLSSYFNQPTMDNQLKALVMIISLLISNKL